MKPFAYEMAANPAGAVTAGSQAGSAYIAGGTTLVDLWKLDAYPMDRVVDINGLPLRTISATPGHLTLGSLARMSDTAASVEVKQNFPVVSLALELSASPQLRNMASLGGNLMQRPRSISYRNPNPKLKDGPSRFDAIFGVTSRSCSIHPSDFAVAMLVLDGSVKVSGAKGDREIKMSDFYKLPEHDLNLTTLQEGELITAIGAMALPFAHRSAYVKIRDRASYQFAIVSAAVVLDVADGKITEARVAAGGVGTNPWRFPAVEQELQGKALTLAAFHDAVSDIGRGATTHVFNAYKVELLKRTVMRALNEAAQIA